MRFPSSTILKQFNHNSYVRYAIRVANMSALVVSLQCIRSSRWQLQLKTAVWRKPGGHGEDDPVRQRASGPQRAALPPIRQERRSQKDAAGMSDEGIEEGRVLWWYCAILTHQFVVFYIKYWWSGLFKHAIIFWAYKLICSTLLPLVCCWCKYTVEVETWLALWVPVHLHPLCPLASVFVCLCVSVQDAFSLLAYSDPWNCPMGQQLDPMQREAICSALNSAILGKAEITHYYVLWTWSLM